MGIRVHKMIGWGLTDVVHMDFHPNDPRINPDSPLLRYEATLEQYLAYLERRKGQDPDYSLRLELSTLTRAEKPNPFEPQRAFAYDGEYGLPWVLCMRPVWMPDWSRYDNIIDWVEETHIKNPKGENGLDHIQVLPHPIYPFNGIYMDDRSGERITANGLMNFIRLKDHLGQLQKHDQDNLARELTGMGWDEATEHVVPMVPWEIRRLADCFDLFTGPDVWMQLRPMMYVYWS